MKKISVITLVVIMLAISVVPAFAKGSPPTNRGTGTGICDGTGIGINNAYRSGNYGGAQNGTGVQAPYALSGTISAVDANAQTITVTVVCGNRLVKPFIGQDVTLQTTDATRFLLRNTDGTVTPISFEYLAIGQNVSSHGTLVGEVWSATRVTSGALLNCLP